MTYVWHTYDICMTHHTYMTHIYIWTLGTLLSYLFHSSCGDNNITMMNDGDEVVAMVTRVENGFEWRER